MDSEKKYFRNWFGPFNKIKPALLKLAKSKNTPFYVYDSHEARSNLKKFKQAFSLNGIDINVFYAIKSNPCINLLKTIAREGSFLDASSQRELKLALEANPKKIIYTGPAKTEADFKLILQNHSKITVNLESIRELELLDKMAGRQGKKIRCGVRVHTKNQAGWTKFGITLPELRNFYNHTLKAKNIHFCGLHFHMSLNQTPKPYTKTLEEVADYLRKYFTGKELSRFEYVDLGGGFYPPCFEGDYIWNPKQSMNYTVNEVPYDDIFNDRFPIRSVPVPVEPIANFAKGISKIYKNLIHPMLPNAVLYAEPGRFMSHSAMHFVFRMVETKNERMGIVDGGTNMVGWEKYQYFCYVPLFNLSQFDLKREIPYLTYGPLCTPDDVWGYYMYTKNTPKNGDILCMPFQGAYTYTLSQNFIKDIPDIYEI